jgi:hypothetical protein
MQSVVWTALIGHAFIAFSPREFPRGCGKCVRAHRARPGLIFRRRDSFAYTISPSQTTRFTTPIPWGQAFWHARVHTLANNPTGFWLRKRCNIRRNTSGPIPRGITVKLTICIGLIASIRHMSRIALSITSRALVIVASRRQ